MTNMNQDIIFEEVAAQSGKIGLITLNKPRVLNALNHEMFINLDKHLTQWEKSPSIQAVVIRAVEGRAFCAGGDIRHAYEQKMENHPSSTNFFRDEYRMNRRIYHYPKPYIALLDGITMGGGVGVSLHGSHRVATDRLVFAMPETGIGFFPDVGTTYCLSRMPHKMGFYLGLTGARITYADCLALGIVQQVVARDSLTAIVQALVDASLLTKDSVTDLLQSFTVSAPAAELFDHKDAIEKHFAKNTVEEILQSLESDASAWCQQVAAVIKTKSPTSLKVTLHALQAALKMNFDDCMQMDYRLTSRFLQGQDFFEGVRAAIIDKDQKPRWQPASLSEVKVSQVEHYFEPLTEELV